MYSLKAEINRQGVGSHLSLWKNCLKALSTPPHPPKKKFLKISWGGGERMRSFVSVSSCFKAFLFYCNSNTLTSCPSHPFAPVISWMWPFQHRERDEYLSDWLNYWHGLDILLALFDSILGRIVRVTEEVVSYRKWVKENYVVLTPSPARSSYAAIASSTSSGPFSGTSNAATDNDHAR